MSSCETVVQNCLEQKCVGSEKVNLHRRYVCMYVCIAHSPWLRKVPSLWHRMRCQQTRLCEVSTDPSGRHTLQAIGRHTPHSLALRLRLRKRYYLTRVWATTARVWQQLRLEWAEGDLSATPRHCAYACHVSGLSGPEEICLPVRGIVHMCVISCHWPSRNPFFANL